MVAATWGAVVSTSGGIVVGAADVDRATHWLGLVRAGMTNVV